MKLIPFLIFAFGLTDLHSQEKTIYSGFYVDSFKYRPSQLDTYRFEMYFNGSVRMMEERQYIWITDLSDVRKKKVNYTIQVDKFSRAKEYDSFKTVDHYKDDKHFRSTHFQKLAFKQSGGCFVYENKRTSYWFQTGFSTFEYDQNGTCIKQTEYYEFDKWRDTTKYFNIVLYDSYKRITELKNYRSDTLYQTNKYSYEPNYKKSQTFSSKNELINSLEEFMVNGKLIKTIEYNRYGSGGTVEKRYFYNESGLLSKEESFSIKLDSSKDLYQIRTYNYY